jgi:small-conductance mechanosensitive channel
VLLKRSGHRCHHRFLGGVLLATACCLLNATAAAGAPEDRAGEPPQQVVHAQEVRPSAPTRVAVKPASQDEEIRKRLQRVLDATEWFTDPSVRVEEGVVFLGGSAKSTELKDWAGDLVHNTQDVVAVVNRLEVAPPSIWDVHLVQIGMVELWRDFLRALPFIVLGLLILGLSMAGALLASRGTQAMLMSRVRTRLLRNVIARTAGVVVVLGGVYLVLRVSGLTQLALTLVGGTGLIGLIVGIAFRDITENFLASIFISLQPPFETGDLVEITGVTGYVQQLNMRTTILMTLDGNIVQIPNSTVYKSSLSNYTTNANRCENFVIGIGYDDAINEAQEIARQVLVEHPAVLKDPEPTVLADSLGTSTVNLRVYFWLDGREYSWLKVRSSVIRLVKRAYQEHGISMPDAAREVVFPQGITATMLDASPTRPHGEAPRKPSPLEDRHEELDVASTKAEAGLYSEAIAIGEQARQAQPIKEGENLLPGVSDPSVTKDARASGTE